LRVDPIADAEINRLARKIATQLKAEAPNFFSDCTVTLDAVLFAHHKV
jgi:thymidylate synthase ThyX